jgi:hypothetical protein
MFSMIVYSFGWCATSSIFDQTTAPKPWRLKKAATVPPPMPYGFAFTRCAEDVEIFTPNFSSTSLIIPLIAS